MSKKSETLNLDFDDDENLANFTNSAQLYSKLSQSAKYDAAQAHCRALTQMSTDHSYYVTVDRVGKIRICVKPNGVKNDIPF